MEVKIIKGTKQIGGCITEINEGNTKIIIDFGNDLEKKDYFELEGLTYGKSRYKGVFITHSHSDHIGLINEINEDIPVYVEYSSLKIHNLTCDFCNEKKITREINLFTINNSDKKVIFNNSDIKVTAYMGDHSSYNSCMFLIEGNGKKILHTGDFRMHGRKKNVIINSLKRIGKVDMLITEGTTLTRCNKNFISEKDLEEEAVKIMKKYNQVLIMQSSTNFDRTASFIRASIKTNKKFIADLFSYHLQDTINRFFKVDNKTIYLWKPFKYKDKSDLFKEKYLNIDNSLNGVFPYYVMEIKESMLPDIKMLYQKGLLKKSCFIYSMWDGYINKETKLKKFINELKKMNIDIIYLHTSGHADINAYKMLNKLVNPKKTIVIHTENVSNGDKLFNNVIMVQDNETIMVS